MWDEKIEITSGDYDDDDYLDIEEFLKYSKILFFSEIKPGEEYKGQALYLSSLSIPINKQKTGRMYLILVADDTYKNYGDPRANNEKAITVDMVAFGLPDLLRPRYEGPDQVEAGKTAEYTLYIENIGEGSLYDGFIIDVFLSEDKKIDSADQLLASLTHPVISAGKGTIFKDTMKIPIPADAKNQKYYLGVVVDALHRIDESDETNNQGFIEITVKKPAVPDKTAPLPDLTTGTFEGPDEAEAGKPVTYIYKVKNIGWGDVTRSFKVNYYLSEDTKYDTNDKLLTTWNVNELGAGQEIKGMIDLPIPGTAKSDLYYIMEVIDPLDEIAESAEDNNKGKHSLVITKPQTLIPSSSSVQVKTKYGYFTVKLTFPDGETATTGTGKIGDADIVYIYIKKGSGQGSQVRTSITAPVKWQFSYRTDLWDAGPQSRTIIKDFDTAPANMYTLKMTTKPTRESGNYYRVYVSAANGKEDSVVFALVPA